MNPQKSGAVAITAGTYAPASLLSTDVTSPPEILL